MNPKPELSWPAIAGFVRQLTHDARNHLNALELEAALVSDVITDPESAESIQRIRELLREFAGELKELSAKVTDPQPTPSPMDAAELFTIFKEQAAAIHGLPEITWTLQLEKERIHVDTANLVRVIRELLMNAVVYGGENLKVTAWIEEGDAVFELREGKKEPVKTEQWGVSPFLGHRRGKYGLGLWEAYRLVGANGGKLQQRYQPDTKELFSALSFPVQ